MMRVVALTAGIAVGILMELWAFNYARKHHEEEALPTIWLRFGFGIVAVLIGVCFAVYGV